MLVDSHCHLDRLDLTAHDGSLDAALDAARSRGVGHFLCIGVSADNAAAVRSLSERYADVDCSIGVHPLDLEPTSQPVLDWLLGELQHPHVVAIGETGLVWITTTSPKLRRCSSSPSGCILKQPG